MYLQLLGAGLLAVALTVIFHFAETKTPFQKLPYMARQVIIGIFFGGAAVFGTEFGIDAGGAMVNARDAAVVSAGLVFGGPAGIIAGTIGGLERWFCVLWGGGEFTRVACSVSTFLAGIFTALLRKYIFDDKTPKAEIGLLAGLTIEVFHLMMVFLTNMNNTTKALEVIKICTMPMVTVNALSVFLAVTVVTLLRENAVTLKAETKDLSVQIVRRLLVVIMVAFVITLAFTMVFQNNVTESRTTKDLKTTLTDIQADISDESDRNLLRKAKDVAGYVPENAGCVQLQVIADHFDVSEIDVVDQNGIIVASTNPKYVGFDMASGPQSAEFLILLTGMKMEYVQEYRPKSADGVSMKYAGVVKGGGFVQIGYDEERFHADLTEGIARLTLNRHIGDNGYIVIEDVSGVLYSELKDSVKNYPEYTKFRAVVRDVDSYAMYARREGYYIFAVIPVEQANMYRDIELYLTAFMEILLFGALFVVLFIIIKKHIVKSINRINGSLARITAGDLEEKVDVRNATEFSALSDDINATVDKLKDYIAEAKARIDKELEVATNIQNSVLPTALAPNSAHKNVELAAMMDPAKEVGGDFYDFYWMDQHRLSIMISDVSGKGIPAAMFMMRAKTMMKTFVESGIPIEEVFEQVNAGLCEGNDAEMFVTSWLGFVNMETGHVEYVNAGHNPPLVRQGDGDYEYLKGRPGFVLAGMEGMKYKKQEIDLEPGSSIFLYTDGAPEAHNAEKQLYGEERLLQVVNANKDGSMQDLCTNLRADIADFAAGVDQFDDITMVALRMNK